MNVLTVGCFDMLHEGHVNLLRAMRKEGDVVVGLHDDASIFENKGRFPVQPYEIRERFLQMSGLARGIYPVFRADPSEFFRRMLQHKPLDWMVMRGDDWEDFPGREAVENLGVPIKFVAYTEGVSSTERRR